MKQTAKQKLSEVHCLAERILDEIELKKKPNLRVVKKTAVQILDISLSE